MFKNISKYNDFILESKFNKIVDEIFLLVESEGKWLDDRTLVWEFGTKNKKTLVDKLKNFLKKLPKEKIKEYFFKLLRKIKSLPDKLRRKLIITYSFAFLSFVSINYLINTENSNIESEFKEELMIIKSEMGRLNKKSNFEQAQEVVKLVEGGYSSDRKDRGNYVNTKFGKRFVGTKYGISAPVLMDYLGKIPTVDDMKNLSYENALEIYKKQYWTPQNLSLFNNQYIANMIYDGCVNQGIRAMKDIVRTAYIENGIELGSLENPFQEKWIKMANDLDHESLFNSIKKGREKRYKESITFKTHGTGWLNRLNSLDIKN
jgi:lysozyme family protein